MVDQKRSDTVRELARIYTKEAIATLAEIMHDKNEKGAARARAAEAILDRAWGRASATMELTGADSDPMQQTGAKDELARIIARIATRGVDQPS